MSDQNGVANPGRPVIFLIGPRGSGKSTVARMLAARLGWDWTDADAELERRCGHRIRDIFTTDGENAFRDRESAVLVDLCQLDRHVIATRGGVVLRPENRERLRAAGRLVWLTAPAETPARRLQSDETSPGPRPALTRRTAASSRPELVQVLP